MEYLKLLRNFQIDNNGPAEKIIAEIEKTLGESSLWGGAIIRQDTESFLIL